MTFRFSSALLVVSGLLGSLACSANSGSGSGVGRGNGGSVNSGSAGSGAINVGDGTTTTNDPTDTRNLPIRQKVCDASGNCTCLRLALLGTLDSSADDTDTQPFIDWLNMSSGGTATVTMISSKPTVNQAFLANYDILLVANVNTWAFSADEQAAVTNWVKTTGGGIISLTGFTSEASEPAATSQLIKFAGITYGSTQTATAPQAQTEPVYYKGGTTNLKDCLQWQPAPTANKADITAPIKFSAETGSLEKLTVSVNYVGAFYGWNIVAPADATLIGTDPVTKLPIGSAYEYMGTGRIFAWGDEWVIFKNQWEKSGMPSNMQADQYNPCWVPASGNAAGFFQSVESLYQTKQFWYDVINWVAPPNACNFVVNDPDVTIK